jgi:DNA-binding Xre family transcriptional regulator
MRDGLVLHRLLKPMNRIREIREAAGLSSDELAERVGTSGAQIRRLETGERRLTAEWMEKIAEELGCTPADLISNATIAEAENEVQPMMDGADLSSVMAAIAHRGLRVYKVTEDGRSVARVGIGPGDVITVDESPDRIAGPRTGDILLVRFDDNTIVLRQFLEPGLLVTNRRGANLAIDVNDPAVNPQIIGVVVRQ